MKRNNPPSQTTPVSYDVPEEPIVLSKPLLDKLLKQSTPADLIGLYCFYYYTAKWQQTNQPRATVSFTAKAMRWGPTKTRNRKQELIKLNLISDVIKKNRKGIITGHYIKVHFLWGKEKLQTTLSKTDTEAPPYRSDHGWSNPEGNSLSPDNKEKSLSPNKEKILEADTPVTHILGSEFDPITETMFEDFWKIYPKRAYKGAAKKAWKGLCGKFPRPSWNRIREAVLAQKETPRWTKDNQQFVPHPTTWINQERWLDDPKEMNINYDAPPRTPGYKFIGGHKESLQRKTI